MGFIFGSIIEGDEGEERLEISLGGSFKLVQNIFVVIPFAEIPGPGITMPRPAFLCGLFLCASVGLIDMSHMMSCLLLFMNIFSVTKLIFNTFKTTVSLIPGSVPYISFCSE